MQSVYLLSHATVPKFIHHQHWYFKLKSSYICSSLFYLHFKIAYLKFKYLHLKRLFYIHSEMERISSVTPSLAQSDAPHETQKRESGAPAPHGTACTACFCVTHCLVLHAGLSAARRVSLPICTCIPRYLSHSLSHPPTHPAHPHRFALAPLPLLPEDGPQITKLPPLSPKPQLTHVTPSTRLPRRPSTPKRPAKSRQVSVAKPTAKCDTPATQNAITNGVSQTVAPPQKGSQGQSSSMDGEIAKALKVFFRDVKEVQKKVVELKSLGTLTLDNCWQTYTAEESGYVDTWQLLTDLHSWRVWVRWHLTTVDRLTQLKSLGTLTLDNCWQTYTAEESGYVDTWQLLTDLHSWRVWVRWHLTTVDRLTQLKSLGTLALDNCWQTYTAEESGYVDTWQLLTDLHSWRVWVRWHLTTVDRLTQLKSLGMLTLDNCWQTYTAEESVYVDTWQLLTDLHSWSVTVTICLTEWQFLWPFDRLLDTVTVFMTLWLSAWHSDSFYDPLTVCLTQWQFLWPFDRLLDTVTVFMTLWPSAWHSDSFYDPVTVCLTQWQFIWPCDRLLDTVTVYMTLWPSAWHSDSLYDPLTVCLTQWQFLWPFDRLLDTVTVYMTLWPSAWHSDSLYDPVTVCLAQWQFIWPFDRLLDTVTVYMTLWPSAWHSDSLYDPLTVCLTQWRFVWPFDRLLDTVTVCYW